MCFAFKIQWLPFVKLLKFVIIAPSTILSSFVAIVKRLIQHTLRHIRNVLARPKWRVKSSIAFDVWEKLTGCSIVNYALQSQARNMRVQHVQRFIQLLQLVYTTVEFITIAQLCVLWSIPYDFLWERSIRWLQIAHSLLYRTCFGFMIIPINIRIYMFYERCR